MAKYDAFGDPIDEGEQAPVSARRFDAFGDPIQEEPKPVASPSKYDAFGDPVSAPEVLQEKATAEPIRTPPGPPMIDPITRLPMTGGDTEAEGFVGGLVKNAMTEVQNFAKGAAEAASKIDDLAEWGVDIAPLFMDERARKALTDPRAGAVANSLVGDEAIERAVDASGAAAELAGPVAVGAAQGLIVEPIKSAYNVVNPWRWDELYARPLENTFNLLLLPALIKGGIKGVRAVISAVDMKRLAPTIADVTEKVSTATGIGKAEVESFVKQVYKQGGNADDVLSKTFREETLNSLEVQKTKLRKTKDKVWQDYSVERKSIFSDPDYEVKVAALKEKRDAALRIYDLVGAKMSNTAETVRRMNTVLAAPEGKAILDAVPLKAPGIVNKAIDKVVGLEYYLNDRWTPYRLKIEDSIAEMAKIPEIRFLGDEALAGKPMSLTERAVSFMTLLTRPKKFLELSDGFRFGNEAKRRAMTSYFFALNDLAPESRAAAVSLAGMPGKLDSLMRKVKRGAATSEEASLALRAKVVSDSIYSLGKEAVKAKILPESIFQTRAHWYLHGYKPETLRKMWGMSPTDQFVSDTLRGQIPIGSPEAVDLLKQRFEGLRTAEIDEINSKYAAMRDRTLPKILDKASFNEEITIRLPELMNKRFQDYDRVEIRVGNEFKTAGKREATRLKMDGKATSASLTPEERAVFRKLKDVSLVDLASLDVDDLLKMGALKADKRAAVTAIQNRAKMRLKQKNYIEGLIFKGHKLDLFDPDVNITKLAIDGEKVAKALSETVDRAERAGRSLVKIPKVGGLPIDKDLLFVGPSSISDMQDLLNWRKFLGGISDSPELSSLQPRPNWIQATEDYWGPLKGKFVEPVTHADIQSMRNVGSLLAKYEVLHWLWSKYQRGLSLWKQGKLFWSPMTMAGNAYTNFIACDFAGVKITNSVDRQLLGVAAKQMYSHGPLYRQFIQDGGSTGMAIKADLKAVDMAVGDALKYAETTGEVGFMGGFMEGLGNAIKKGHKIGGKAYSSVDEIFRFWIYLNRTHVRGMTGQQAALDAVKYLYDVGKLPEAAKLLRNTTHPFIGFTWSFFRRMGVNVWERPFTAMKYMALGYGMTAAADAYFGQTPEEGRSKKLLANMKADEAFYKEIPLPEFIGKPWKDDVFNLLDLSRIGVVGGAFAPTYGGQGAMPQVLQQGNPALNVAWVFATGEDPFTGRVVFDRDIDDDVTEWGPHFVSYAWRTLLPGPTPGLHELSGGLLSEKFTGGTSFERVKAAAQERNEFRQDRGYRMNLFLAAMDVFFGVKILQFSREEQVTKARRWWAKTREKIEYRRITANEQYEQGTPEWEAAMDEINEDIKELDATLYEKEHGEPPEEEE